MTEFDQFKNENVRPASKQARSWISRIAGSYGAWIVAGVIAFVLLAGFIFPNKADAQPVTPPVAVVSPEEIGLDPETFSTCFGPNQVDTYQCFYTEPECGPVDSVIQAIEDRRDTVAAGDDRVVLDWRARNQGVMITAQDGLHHVPGPLMTAMIHVREDANLLEIYVLAAGSGVEANVCRVMFGFWLPTPKDA